MVIKICQNKVQYALANWLNELLLTELQDAL